MLFQERFRLGIKRGDVTMAYRRWTTPRVRAGGRQRFDADGVIVFRSIETVDAASITETQARSAGYDDRSELLRELARFDDGGTSCLYGVTFRYVHGSDPRTALAVDDALTDDDAAAIVERLARMDRGSANGAWTRATLALIAQQPGTPAAVLAAQLARERLPFKADVRKLKALGLTISLETGYRISPRGEAILRHLTSCK